MFFLLLVSETTLHALTLLVELGAATFEHQDSTGASRSSLRLTSKGRLMSEFPLEPLYASLLIRGKVCPMLRTVLQLDLGFQLGGLLVCRSSAVRKN
eukprot:SAG31_NODE_4126_length_3560_cov_2.073678_4_plen_97_part_00